MWEMPSFSPACTVSIFIHTSLYYVRLFSYTRSTTPVRLYCTAVCHSLLRKPFTSLVPRSTLRRGSSRSAYRSRVQLELVYTLPLLRLTSTLLTVPQSSRGYASLSARTVLGCRTTA